MKKISARQKYLAVIIASAVFLLGILASCVRTPLIPVTSSVTPIRVVMDNNYPPYIFLDKDGDAQGILVDQWNLWEKYTGVKVFLSAISWDDALEGMRNGEYDVIDTIFYTGERAQIYDFTDAYARIDVPIFFHNNISGIAGLDDLSGFRVAVKTGDADAEFLENAGLKDLVYYDSYEEIIQAAKRGDENIFVIDQPPGLYYLYKYGIQDQFNRSEPLFSGEFHRAVKKGDAELLALVEEGFASISDAEYQKIDERWFGTQQGNEWGEHLSYIMAGAVVAFLIICILIIFNRTLQRQVNRRTLELKQALVDLQKSERWYREVFDAPTEAIFIQSVSTGRILHVNKAMLEMFGYESEEDVLSGGMISSMDEEPPYSKADAREKEKLAIKEGPQVFEWLARKKTGERFWTDVSLRYLEIDGEGQILAVVRDISRRKQVEEAFFESEARYRRLVNDATDIIFRYDIYPEMKLTYINPAVELVTGYTPEECYADPLLMMNMIHPDNLNLMAGYVQSLILPDGPLFARWIGRDGVIRWMESRITPVKNADGRLIAVEGITRDITARKQVEEALRESESLLREAQVVADMGSYVLDFSTGMWQGSDVLDKIFGIEGSYVRSVEGWSNLIHPDYRQQMTDYFLNEIVDRQMRFDREYKIIRHNDGAERWVHGLGNLEFDSQNKLVKMSGVIQDITERKQAEQLLRDRERQYRALVEQIPAIVYLDDVSDNIRTLYVSPQVEKILGYTPQEWLAQSPEIWDACIQAEDREAIHEKYLRCVKTGEPFEAEYRMVSADGRVVWLHDQAVMLPDENGKPKFSHGVMQDITARKLAEAEIRQRVVELETLYESGLTLNQLLDPVKIGQKTIELLEQKLSWHHTTVRLYHPQDESLELLAFNQPGLKNEAERREVEQRFKSLVAYTNQGLSGLAVQNKQVIRSSNLPEDPHYVNTYPGLRSGLYVPMKLGERVIGVISIESEQPNAFSSTDERLAVTLANQAASALENARLFQVEQKQRHVSDALRDALSAGASLSALLDFETILDRLLESVERVVPFDGGSIMLVQKETHTTKFARMRGYTTLGSKALERITALKFDISTVENLRWMMEHKQPLVIPDVQKYPGWATVQDTSFIRSWAGAPIIVNDEVIAFFSLDSSEPNFFTNEHAELIKAFTGQASLALQNARLFEETERRFREFAALYETSNFISSESNLYELLQIIVENARKLLDAASSGIYLYDPDRDELVLTVETMSDFNHGARLRMGEGAGGTVAQTRQPLRLDDYSTWEGRSLQFDERRIRALLEVPMLYSGELIGVLAADEVDDSERKFTEADERLLSLFASQAAGAIHLARLREQTQRRLGQLQALHTIDRAISSSFDLGPILNTVIAHTISQLSVDAVDVLLYRPHLQTLDYVAGQGFRTRAIEQTHLRLGEGFSGRAALDRRTVHISDLTEAGGNFIRSSILQSEGFLELYAVPLIAKGQVKGVLEVFNRTALPANPEWLDFLETLAGQAAITIDQTQLFENLQRANLELVIAYDATIEGWARAMDLRDKETESHTERVTKLTISLARRMGIRESEILHIRRGALLHDIGKMGVPDQILLKEGALTEAEWEIMRHHPQFAYEMLQPIEYLRQSLDIPYCHHEKWDGTGYPRGLKGEQIPLAARIFSIADVWDAITSDRPYRKAWTTETALSHIMEQSGKQFDPKVVEMFLKSFENERN